MFYQHLLGLLGMVAESEKRPLQKAFYRARDEAGDSIWRTEGRVKTWNFSAGFTGQLSSLAGLAGSFSGNVSWNLGTKQVDKLLGKKFGREDLCEQVEMEAKISSFIPICVVR